MLYAEKLITAPEWDETIIYFQLLPHYGLWFAKNGCSMRIRTSRVKKIIEIA